MSIDVHTMCCVRMIEVGVSSSEKRDIREENGSFLDRMLRLSLKV